MCVDGVLYTDMGWLRSQLISTTVQRCLQHTSTSVRCLDTRRRAVVACRATVVACSAIVAATMPTPVAHVSPKSFGLDNLQLHGRSLPDARRALTERLLTCHPCSCPSHGRVTWRSLDIFPPTHGNHKSSWQLHLVVDGI